MNKTRLSLYYPVTYLWLGGMGFLLAPELSARLLLSTSEYAPVMLRSSGMFMIGIGIFVVQILRLHAQSLYATTLLVRLFICIGLLTFYFQTSNRLFLFLFCIVALGMSVTGFFFWSERRSRLESGFAADG